jgi:hypothetical protein
MGSFHLCLKEDEQAEKRGKQDETADSDASVKKARNEKCWL